MTVLNQMTQPHSQTVNKLTYTQSTVHTQFTETAQQKANTNVFHKLLTTVG